MSLIYRAVLATRTIQKSISNVNLVNINFNLLIPSCGNCKCKIFATSTVIRRDYSSKNAEKSEKTNAQKLAGQEVIYEGFLRNNIRRLKVLSILTSTVGVSIQPILYNKVVTAGTVTPMTLPLFGLIAMLAIATPPLLHIVTKRYVIQVDYDSKNDKYIATVYNLFAFEKKIEFTPDDVTIPTVLGMFTNCLIKGRPAFLDAKYFTDQIHYIRIMGYDKPIDLEVNNNETCSNKKDN